MDVLNNILVVSMCTKHCVKAVQWGISLAKNYKAKLFIIHIIRDNFGPGGWKEKEFVTTTQKAKEALDQYIRSADTTSLSMEETIIEGNPKDEIIKFIKKKQIDLLIMVAHQQEIIEHFILGQEIHDLVRKMPCSIFLVHRELEYKHFRT